LTLRELEGTSFWVDGQMPEPWLLRPFLVAAKGEA